MKLSRDAIRNVIRQDDRRAVPSVERAKEICEALGLEFYIGPPRQQSSPLHDPRAFDVGGDDFDLVRMVETRASAGPGAWVEGEAVIAEMAFRTDWLSRKGIAPDKARLMRIHGDSMAPTVPAGAVALVDLARRSVKDRKIYILRREGELFCKRLFQVSGIVVAVSDSGSPDYPPFTLSNRDADTAIIGQVRWVAHELGDAV